MSDEILDEYETLVALDTYIFLQGFHALTPELRAWIRETDRVCRANAALLQGE